MNRDRTLLVASLGVLMVAAGCGSGSKFNPNNVTVTVAPATATTTTNGQVVLQATVKRDISPGLVLMWSVAENTSARS